MIIVVLGLLALLSPALTGGHLGRLAQLRLEGMWLILLALVVQIVIIDFVPGANATALGGLHVLSYLLAAGFVVLNRRVPGLPLMAVGAACNGITIALNGGTLPASAAALRAAGYATSASGFVNSGTLANPRLSWLGDVFSVPAWLPLANVFSVGDVLILVGVAWGSHRICDSRLVPARLRRPVAPTSGAGVAAEQPAHPA
jgi:hypothetical protein